MKRNFLLSLALAATASFSTAQEKKPEEKPFMWRPELSKQGPVLVSVSLKTQTAAVYRNGVLIGNCEVSTGRPGHKTPTGVFHILNKDANHHSSSYHNAPMPFSERLTWGGVALHAGSLPGYPVSHGCVHLPYDFAENLFGITHTGTTVIITNSAPDKHLGTSDRVDFKDGPDSDFTWTPDASPEGPVCLIYSSADKKVVIVRNGINIGEGTVETDAHFQDPQGTTAYIFSDWTHEDGQLVAQWLHPDKGDEKVTIHGWFKIDPRFRFLMEGLLVPGSTLVITSDPLTADSRSDRGFAILQGDKEATALKK